MSLHVLELRLNSTTIDGLVSSMVTQTSLIRKLSVPERPTDLDNSRARDCCASIRCGWTGGYFFLVDRFSFSFSVSLGDGWTKTELLFQRAVKLKTNQINSRKTLQMSLICTEISYYRMIGWLLESNDLLNSLTTPIRTPCYCSSRI